MKSRDNKKKATKKEDLSLTKKLEEMNLAIKTAEESEISQKAKIPLYVIVKHKKDTFIIFTQEFSYAKQIKEEISKIKEIPIESIKLYYNNKRPIDDDVTNHDQQICHTCKLYAVLKNPDNNEWETINEVINFA